VNSARHVVRQISKPRISSKVLSYDAASVSDLAHASSYMPSYYAASVTYLTLFL